MTSEYSHIGHHYLCEVNLQMVGGWLTICDRDVARYSCDIRIDGRLAKDGASYVIDKVYARAFDGEGYDWNAAPELRQAVEVYFGINRKEQERFVESLWNGDAIGEAA